MADWDVEEAQRQQDAASEQRDRDRVDAERWRALLASGRIRILGTARDGQPDMHFGAEFWVSCPGDNASDNGHGREVLLSFVDAARARGFADSATKKERLDFAMELIEDGGMSIEQAATVAGVEAALIEREYPVCNGCSFVADGPVRHKPPMCDDEGKRTHSEQGGSNE